MSRSEGTESAGRGRQQDALAVADSVAGLPEMKPRHHRRTPGLPRKIRYKLKRLTVAYSDSLRADPDLAPAIQNNREAVRSDILRLIRLQFPLKRGRPTNPLLDVACRMIDQGKTVPEVLRLQFPDYEKRDLYERLLLSKGMHAAHRRRHPTKSPAIADRNSERV